MKALRWLLVFAPFLPLVVFSIPHGATLMPEPWDPWYTRYTTPVWLACAIFIYPVTGILQVFGIQPRSVIHILGMVLYATGIAAISYRLLSRQSRTNAPQPTGPRSGAAT
ncbi:MAG TPA: hypothetical protein VGP73_08345 [Thermoanaerobaculia bacterium]